MQKSKFDSFLRDLFWVNLFTFAGRTVARLLEVRAHPAVYQTLDLPWREPILWDALFTAIVMGIILLLRWWRKRRSQKETKKENDRPSF